MAIRRSAPKSTVLCLSASCRRTGVTGSVECGTLTIAPMSARGEAMPLARWVGLQPHHREDPPARPVLITFERYRIRKSPLPTSTSPRIHPQSHFMRLIGA